MLRIEFAPAKINLHLRINGRRDDGYHELDSLVGFASIGDVLRVGCSGRPDARRPDIGLSVSGPFASPLTSLLMADNLAWRAGQAAIALSATTYPVSVRIELDKHIPIAAGMGGASADAAAVLRAMMAALQLSRSDVLAAALRLGADVPVCLTSTAARMTGIGETVSLLQKFPTLDAVLVNPGIEVATKSVFTELDRVPIPDSGAGHDFPEAGERGQVLAWLAQERNDLQPAALRIAPVIGEVLDALRASPEAVLARMTGSGASCFALYPNSDTGARAATWLAERAPVSWWIRPCQIG